MKFLRSFLNLFVIVLLLSGIANSLSSKELPATNRTKLTNSLVPSIELYKNLKTGYDKPLAVVFRTLDSLANAYSYFTNDQQPFVFSPITNEIVTVKRGFNIASAPSNTLNDLYILVSKDWGLTWGPAQQVYSASANPGSLARYPSVFAFEYDAKTAYVFTSPITDGNGWKGFINGLLYDNTPITTIQTTMTIGGQPFGWGGTDSKIVGGVIGSDPFGLAVGGLMPPSGSFDLSSSIGMRFTTTFEDWTPSIPAQWAANKYLKPYAQQGYTDSLRNSGIMSLKKELSNNKLYFAAYARFLAAQDTSKWIPGVSVSDDNGTTWSDYEIFPRSIIDQYATSKSVNPDAVYIGSQDFVVFPNGDYSFVIGLNEDTTVTGTPYADAIHDIVELYKEGSQFGLRPIGKTTGYSLAYVGATGNNQMGDELMVTRTVDGSKLLVKWVDFVDAQDGQGNIIKNYTTDIFATVRAKSSSTWSTPKDITESEIYDRITWIPDYIPNDLKNIPILKVESIPNSADTPDEARIRQRSLENDPQYVMIANFDGDILLSNDDKPVDVDFVVGNVYPNPANDKVVVDINLPQSGQIDVTLTDILGRTVKNLLSQNANGGLSAFELNLGNNPSGVYLLRIDFNGSQTTKMINIIK